MMDLYFEVVSKHRKGRCKTAELSAGISSSKVMWRGNALCCRRRQGGFCRRSTGRLPTPWTLGELLSPFKAPQTDTLPLKKTSRFGLKKP